MEDWLKFGCLIFHHVSGLIMTHITRFKVITGALSRIQFFWGCGALGIEGTVFSKRRKATHPKTQLHIAEDMNPKRHILFYF